MLETEHQPTASPAMSASPVGKVEDASGGGLTLDGLIKELHEIFASDRVDVDQVRRLMESYRSRPADWRRFAKFDRYRYTRNLVDAGNGKFNLMILCWGEGHGSAIHDHSDAHCFMKMLQGTLSEIRFAWPEHDEHEHDDADIAGHGPKDGDGLKETGRSQIMLNDVCYINDSLGLHRVENPSHTEAAVSLHLYCPPFDECRVFNQQTGRKSVAKVTFWSKYGERTSGEEKVAARQPEDN
ncbi:cysteine dioxygenase type 1 [Ischnura elegans]|uniref:cysteine dioxygenase type 1 n=1 Tax=Ischnura elegans TaxID=197161 RepID=UPI001ED875D7|nr:cysteine dioxygenase type 1 [Ischnura elegans]